MIEADRPRITAARREGAPLRQCGEIRRHARNGVKDTPAHTCVNGRSHQPFGVRVPWAFHDLLDGAEFDQAARIHHADAIGDLAGHAQIVSDEDRRHPEPLLQFAQEKQNLNLDGRVECRCRLVREQQLRAGRKRMRDHDALPQPSR